MAGFFGPSEQDLERLRSTVQSLGTTSVPGLAAALSWREHKAERLLVYELGRPGTPIAYDPGRRTVRWARPPPIAPPPSAPAPAPVSAPAHPPSDGPAAPPVPVFTPVGLKALCPSCHVPLQTTGSASLAVCPQCGRLSSPRAGPPAPDAKLGTPARPPAPPPVRPPRAAVPPAPEPARTPPATLSPAAPTPAAAPGDSVDRRSQEMFAAWVTSKPIPCPKCRTPLRHRGVSEYTCPSCGHQVRFPSTGAPGPAVPAGPAR